MSRGTWELQAPSRFTFVYRTGHLLWWAVPGPSASQPVFYSARYPNLPPLKPHNPQSATRSDLTRIAFRLLPFRSPLLGESDSFSLPPGTEMFQFPGCRFPALRPGLRRMNSAGLPHSEISGSKPVCGSPKLIAACHVLHRLFVPSHPPSALGSLTTEISSASPHERLLSHRANCLWRCDVTPIQLSKSQDALLLRVEMGGIEPPTPCLQSRCSPN